MPVGREITDLMPFENRDGSCIVVLATDAPLSSRQCARMAKRCALGLARRGLVRSRRQRRDHGRLQHRRAHPARDRRAAGRASVGDDATAELFAAAVDATAEAVVNSLCMAVDVEGRDGNVAYALPLDRLVRDHDRARAACAVCRAASRVPGSLGDEAEKE